ncbi:MAG: hypothetical protein OXG04_11055 [Acidobacteria bacterium]|nr:hypothetical protein [Acidobacteriota bacterium]
MTWLYVVVAGAAVARWGLWYLRDVVEWFEEPRRDCVPPAMAARLRFHRDRGPCPMSRMPMLTFPGEAAGGPRSV